METKVHSTGATHKQLPENYVRPESNWRRLSEVSECADVPLIDLGCHDFSVILQQIRHAGDFGFFKMVNHGMPKELEEEMKRVKDEFFELLVDEILKLYSDDPSKTKRLSASLNVKEEEVHDWRDCLWLHCWPVDQNVPDWPSNPPSFKLSQLEERRGENSVARLDGFYLLQSSMELPPWQLERNHEFLRRLVAQNHPLYTFIAKIQGEWVFVPIHGGCLAEILRHEDAERRLCRQILDIFGTSEAAGAHYPAFITEADARDHHHLPALGLTRTRTARNSTQLSLLHTPLPPATSLCGVSFNMQKRISGDGVIIQIQQPGVEIEPNPAPAPTITILPGWMEQLDATLRNKFIVLMSRTEGISDELLVGLTVAASQSLYQNQSMTTPNKYVLMAANGIGFLFLLSGMLRRGCSHANLLIFFGIILAAAGTIFSLSVDVPGPLGWIVSIACLFIVIIASVC